jgi:hypothetical protein
MIKSKKLRLSRETLAILSTAELRGIRGGDSTRISAFPVACEPSGIRACPPEE